MKRFRKSLVSIVLAASFLFLAIPIAGYAEGDAVQYTAIFNAASYNLTAATYTMKATITREDEASLTAADKEGWTLVDETGVLKQSGNTTFSGKTASIKVARADATSFASGNSTVALVKNGQTYATTTVNYSPSATITTDSSTKMIEEGPEAVTALKINGVAVDIADYVISSDDETAATVEKDGLNVTITPLKEGKATFTVAKASDSNASAKANITFKNAAAKIGDTYYDTIDKALKAASSGDTVTLLKDTTESVNFSGNTPRVDGFEVTIDLNGKTWTGSNSSNPYALRVDYGIVIVKDSVGGGGVHYGSDYAFVVSHLAGNYTSRLVLESGTFTGKTSVVQVGMPGGTGAKKMYYGGELVVNGGTFKTVLDEGETYDSNGHFKYTLNKLDYNAANYPGGKYSESKITVNGGIFENFDPMNNVAEGEGTNFVADGYRSVYKDDENFIIDLDKSALEDAITKAKAAVYGITTSEDGKDLSPGTKYTTPAEKKSLENAIDSAQAVVDNTSMTQKEVDDAVTAIEEATATYKAAKKTAKVDKNDLAKAIAVAEKKAAEEIDKSVGGKELKPGTEYITPEDQKALEDAIKAAQAVADNSDATQNEIDAAKTAIDKAVEDYEAAKQTANSDKTALDAAINEAKVAQEGIDTSADAKDVNQGKQWTTEAERKTLDDAIKEAQDVVGKTDATQNEIDEATAALKAATDAYNGAKKDGSKPLFGAGENPNQKGTKHMPLALRSTKQGKTNINLTWKKVKGAKSYVVYGNACGKKKMKKIATVKTNKYNVRKVGKKLRKDTYYKFKVVALDKNKHVVSTSKIVHVATKGGKVTNYRGVSIEKSVINKAKRLKAGKTLKLNARQIKQGKGKVREHRALNYETSNAKIATVSKKGVVKGKAKGSCYITAYTQSGTYKRIKVTVK